MCIRGREAMKAIKEQSNGRLDITLYTNSVLGQDTALLSQTIAGALEMYFLPIDLLAPKNQACGMFGVGYAFLNYDNIWKAMDGDLGNYLTAVRRPDRLSRRPQLLRPRLPRDHDPRQTDREARAI